MSLVPAAFLDCVVALGVAPEPGSDTTGPGWIASGFFYGRKVGVNDQGVDEYYVYLASNRHVFDGVDSIIIRANPPADDPQPARDYPVTLNDPDGNPLWIAHPDESIDVAVIKVDYNRIRAEGMQTNFFMNDKTAMTAEQMLTAGTTEGDYVYVLGYPMGLVGEQRAVVIVRNGSIARIRDALAGTDNSFLIDSAIFPGNSGGPVVIRPEAMALQGTTAPSRASLIGIVTGYVSYTEMAVSAQTGRVRMLFEENSGLAGAHLVDAINDSIDADPRYHETRLRFAAPSPDPAGEAAD
jgi:S1-C subfamily serine protease